MSNISTFGTYTLARLGIFAAQRAMDVVGNNISNVNTEGYTRQTLDQVSLNLGGSDRNQGKLDMRIGSGALATGVVQQRDQYIDARYRDELSSVGYMDGRQEGMRQLSTILDEVGDGEDEAGVLEARFNEMVEQMEELHARGAGKDEYDAMFRTTASTVVNTINSISRKLDDVYEKQNVRFRNDLTEVNSILIRIRDLNTSIRDVEIFGGNALEQKDQRNVLLDQLSELTRINVVHEDEVLGAGVTVDKLSVYTMGYPQRCLVQGNFCTQLTVRTVEAEEKADGTLEPLEPLSTELIDDFANYVANNLSVELANQVDDSKKLMQARFDAVAQRHILGEDTPLDKMKMYLSQLKPDPSTLEDETTKARAEANIRAMLSEIAAVKTKDVEDPFLGISTTEMKDEDGRTADLEVDDVTGIMVGTGSGYRLELAQDGNATKYSEKTAAMKIIELLNDSDRYNQETLSDGTVVHYTYELAGSLADGYRIERYNEDGTHNPLVIRGKAYLPIDAAGTISPTAYADPQEAARVAKVLNAELDYPYNIDDMGRETKTEYRAVMNDGGNYEIHRFEVFRGVNHTGETELYGRLQSERELLTKCGVFSTNQQIQKDEECLDKRGIPFYQKTLDVLANTFATVMNKINKDAGGDNLFSNSTTSDNDGTEEDGGERITAANISISKSWANGSFKVHTTADGSTEERRVRVENSTDPTLSTGQDNLVKFLNALTGEQEFFAHGGTREIDGGLNLKADWKDKFFTGSFQELFTNHMGGTLANDYRATNAMLENYSTTAEDLYVDRDAVMGVDLNDEAMNMMMYQKSYAAACRLMTTFDSMLDRLINGTAL